MGAMASQITSLTIVYSTVYLRAVQRKHQSSVSLAFVHKKGPVTQKCFHLIMSSWKQVLCQTIMFLAFVTNFTARWRAGMPEPMGENCIISGARFNVGWSREHVSLEIVNVNDLSFYMMTSSNGKIFRVTGPFVRGIHRWPVNSPHKGQWRGALVFSLICAWMNNLVYNRKPDDLRCHRAH